MTFWEMTAWMAVLGECLHQLGMSIERHQGRMARWNEHQRHIRALIRRQEET